MVKTLMVNQYQVFISLQGKIEDSEKQRRYICISCPPISTYPKHHFQKPSSSQLSSAHEGRLILKTARNSQALYKSRHRTSLGLAVNVPLVSFFLIFCI